MVVLSLNCLSVKERASDFNELSVRRPPVSYCRLETALDGQTNAGKKYRIRLSVFHPSAVAGSERRSKARQIQSKRTEFVCPSSTLPAISHCDIAGTERRSTARQIQLKRTEFVCLSTRPLSPARNGARQPDNRNSHAPARRPPADRRRRRHARQYNGVNGGFDDCGGNSINARDSE